MKNNQINGKKYDLEERTAKFGEDVIMFCRKLNVDLINRPIITQLVKSSTSIGANYCEADDAESKSDFRHKVGIAKKEARETKHHLRMLAISNPNSKEDIRMLWAECREIHLILNSIYKSVK